MQFEQENTEKLEIVTAQDIKELLEAVRYYIGTIVAVIFKDSFIRPIQEADKTDAAMSDGDPHRFTNSIVRNNPAQLVVVEMDGAIHPLQHVEGITYLPNNADIERKLKIFLKKLAVL